MNQGPQYSFWRTPSLILIEVAASLFVASAILYPVLVPAKLACEGRGDNPESALKHLGTATIIYSVDYDDTYPAVQTQSEFKTALHPYTKSDALFDAGSNLRTKYTYNLQLSGVPDYNIPKPDQTILIYTPLAESENHPYTHFLIYHVNAEHVKIDASEWPDHNHSLTEDVPSPEGTDQRQTINP